MTWKGAAALFDPPCNETVPADPDELRRELLALRLENRNLRIRLGLAADRASTASREAEFAREANRALRERNRRGDEFS